MNHFNAVVGTLLREKAYRATKYVSPGKVISATRIIHGGRIDGRDRRADIQIKIGTPNHSQRLFIKAAVKAGEPFPVRKIQIQPVPKRRA